MNWAHIHLAINHLPIILVPVGLALLVFAIFRRSEDLTSTSLGILVIAALFGVGVFLTGAPAEGVVEGLPQVSKEAIEAHEEAAIIAAVATGLAGLLALGVLVAGSGKRQVPSWMLIATLGASVASAALLARAANLGAYIRHSEIADARIDRSTGCSEPMWTRDLG
jgi:uncharacterized membrane protein